MWGGLILTDSVLRYIICIDKIPGWNSIGESRKCDFTVNFYSIMLGIVIALAGAEQCGAHSVHYVPDKHLLISVLKL